ncbi:hypothetical protein PCANB_002508 [Pneumocystis canis]|nr:hypothetical protein PCANB_002508 [Pneumocystis canis]
MGGQESKFIFRRGIFRLFEENEIPVDDEYWKQFWTLPKSAEDVFTFFSTQDILHIRNHATKNLRTLIYVVVSKLVFIKDEMDHPERKKEALNCLRIITRIMPFIYEKEETRAWEHGLFWNIRRRKKLYNLYKDTNSSSETSHIINDNMDFKAHLKYTQIIENEEYEREDYVNDTEYEILRPLAEEFLDALNDMFFFAGFTIPIKKAHEKVIYSVWEPGIGHACSIKATAEFDLNKIEILRCILSVVSRSLYFYSYNQEPNLYIIYLITNSNKKVVLNLLCSLINTVINYNPTKWQMFYNHMISLNYRQLLVSYCLRFLLILLDYQIPSLSYIQKDQSQDILVNKYSLYFGKLHRADDIKFLFSGIYKILSRFVQIGSFYFPVTEKSIKYCPEMIMLLWKAFQINHHFKNYLINTNNIMDYIVLLLCYSLEHKKETSHVGLIKICILILQSLSLEPSFYEKLNAGFEHYKILPVSIKTISIKDTYTDFIIISIYMLITTSKGVLNSLYSSMLSILVNIAPYTQNLSVLSCIKLMQLFHSFSSPSFLLANENNHTLLQYLLETFSGIIQYQMKKNLHLIYAILRSSEKFELLRDFTLENALLEVKRKQQLKKNESDNIKIEDTKMASKNDIHFSENTQMYNTFFEANNSNFSIDNDDMSDEINYSENTSIMDNSLTKNLHSSFVGTSSSGSDFLKMKPVVSEKVEKELLKQIDFSLQNKDVSSFEIYTSENMSEISKGFIPTNEWVESWHPYLKLDIILTVLKQLKPKIDNIAFSTSNPNVILEALSSLTVEFDITNPKRRYFVQDDQSINKIEGLLWGHIYVAETKFLTGAIGIWAGTSIKLLKIQELKDSALLLNPKNAIDLVTKTAFKTCAQSSFCKRNRHLAENESIRDKYILDYSHLSLNEGLLEAIVLKIPQYDSQIIYLPLSISFLKTGVVRVKIDELQRQRGNINLHNNDRVRKERYNETEKWVIVSDLERDVTVQNYIVEQGVITVKYGQNNEFELRITHEPFKISFYKNGNMEILFNEHGYLNLEHWRPKSTEDLDNSKYSDPDRMWEESFNGIPDTKPLGPESVSLDITFLNYEHVYGIPEHSSSFSLKETRGENKSYDEPYRLFNTDVFEYESDSPASLYGSIPFMYAHKENSSAAIFWMNPADTWIDIVKLNSDPKSLKNTNKSTRTHWISETGLIDVFVFLNSDFRDIFKHYGELVGYTTLPNIFSLGYHQCRWNYFGEDHVFYIDNSFDEYDIPYDALWLDIEYSFEKAYFIWDKDYFPTPSKLLEKLNSKKRQLVIIVNPHIKKDDKYYAYKEVKDAELFIRSPEGDVYEGHCWPGTSIWIDVTSEKGAKWWSDKFKYDVLKSTFSNLHIWNDMNEPSVFNGPEFTIHKDAIHHGGWENRALHNLYGFIVQYYTYSGLIEKSEKKIRPFILSRSFWAGTSRIGAVWIGDNEASWEHLRASIPEILSLNIAGLSFSGADVGGFFGNPSNELLTRWYQAGIFYPFFRAHSHIDTRLREPWTVPDPYRSIIRSTIRIRYQLLPIWYTSFFLASTLGMPVLRPQFLEFPNDKEGFSIDDQYFIGDSGILVKPVTEESATEVNVYFGDDEPYYDYFDFSMYCGKGYKMVSSPLEKIPMFIHGGSIILRRDRIRRSSLLMMHDPFTVIIALDNKGNAEGSLYLDDGESFDNLDGLYIYKKFIFFSTNSTFTSYDLHNSSNTKKYSEKIKNLRIEKLVIVGSNDILKEREKDSVKIIQHKDTWDAEIVITSSPDKKAKIITVRDPKVSISENWEIIL